MTGERHDDEARPIEHELDAPWFFDRDLGEPGEVVGLDPAEARHATGSRRLRAGDAIVLFDGRGGIAHARLEPAAPAPGRRWRDVAARIGSRQIVAASHPAVEVHLACALPKGERQAVLIAMATQLGMSTFTPLACARSVVEAGEGFRGRATRWAIEACKQARRAHLPEIRQAMSVEECLRAACAAGMALVAHPQGEAIARVLPPPSQGGSEGVGGASDDQRARVPDSTLHPRPGPVPHPRNRGGSLTLLVGPEGGFTDEEIRIAQTLGARIVSLGENVLRIETAAVAMLAWVVLAIRR